MNLFRRVIPLYVHIAHLFLGLLLLFALVTLGHQYRQAKIMLIEEAEEKFSLIGQLTIQELEGLFRPAALSVNLLAQQSLIEANTLAERMANLPYMATLLSAQPSASGVYAGYHNGDLFWLLHWPADTEVQHLVVPANTRWIVKSVRHLGEHTLTDIFALKTMTSPSSNRSKCQGRPLIPESAPGLCWPSRPGGWCRPPPTSLSIIRR